MLRAELAPARVPARLLLEDEHPSSVTDPNKLWNRVEPGQERERGLPPVTATCSSAQSYPSVGASTSISVQVYSPELSGWWGSDRLVRPRSGILVHD